METFDLKDLSKLLTLARKHGVKTLKIDGIEFTLSDMHPQPAKPRGKSAAKAASTAPSQSEVAAALERELSPEELLFWSSNYDPATMNGDSQ